MRFQRILRFEFWPFWFFYFPAYFNWAILAIKARYTTYFTATNPLMNNSGALNTSKFSYLSKLPKAWVPSTLLVEKGVNTSALEQQLEENQFSFPLVLKPDNGERGKGIHLVYTLEELTAALANSKHQHLLLQHYCDYPHEVALLYVRYPMEKKGRITSITTKDFCSLQGDGVHTWEELLQAEIRLSHRWEEIKAREKLPWGTIAEKGEQHLVEPIGSHNLGTQFNNGNQLNSSELSKQLDAWADQLPAFYYGRFDVKYQNWEALLQGENFQLMEINGVNAEPTHIYDPSYSILQAYRDIFSHMRIIYEISEQNRRLGISPKRLKPFLIELIQTALR